MKPARNGDTDMTRITITTENSLEIVKVNGRFASCSGRIESIENVGAGRWVGEACGETFEIIGGKESGGGANDWFVKFSIGYGDQYIPAKSAKHAIELIECV